MSHDLARPYAGVCLRRVLVRLRLYPRIEEIPRHPEGLQLRFGRCIAEDPILTIRRAMSNRHEAFDAGTAQSAISAVSRGTRQNEVVILIAGGTEGSGACMQKFASCGIDPRRQPCASMRRLDLGTALHKAALGLR